MFSEIITVYVENNAKPTHARKVWILLILEQMVHIFTISIQSVNKHKLLLGRAACYNMRTKADVKRLEHLFLTVKAQGLNLGLETRFRN